MPKRIQRKRTKGWKMPEGAVYVGRPTKWGNPHSLQDHPDREQIVKRFRSYCGPENGVFAQEIRRELRGKDLACWCPLDQPCHADVLLEIANG